MEPFSLVVMEHGSGWPAHVGRSPAGCVALQQQPSCALLASTLREADGRLDLVARSSAPDRAKQSLVALAGMLTEALAGTSASVSVRFAETLNGQGQRTGRSARRAADERRPAA